jgi:hypothetical protein
MQIGVPLFRKVLPFALNETEARRFLCLYEPGGIPIRVENTLVKSLWFENPATSAMAASGKSDFTNNSCDR